MMKENAETKADIVMAILFGITATGIVSFLIGCFVAYFSYREKGGFISFNKETSTIFSGIVSGILGGFGGLITTVIVKGMNFDRAKSVVTGGIINILIPIMLVYALDGGFKGDSKDLQDFGMFIFGQFIAGGIAGLLISLFFDRLSENILKREEMIKSLRKSY